MLAPTRHAHARSLAPSGQLLSCRTDTRSGAAIRPETETRRPCVESRCLPPSMRPLVSCAWLWVLVALARSITANRLITTLALDTKDGADRVFMHTDFGAIPIRLLPENAPTVVAAVKEMVARPGSCADCVFYRNEARPKVGWLVYLDGGRVIRKHGRSTGPITRPSVDPDLKPHAIPCTEEGGPGAALWSPARPAGPDPALPRGGGNAPSQVRAGGARSPATVPRGSRNGSWFSARWPGRPFHILLFPSLPGRGTWR